MGLSNVFSILEEIAITMTKAMMLFVLIKKGKLMQSLYNLDFEPLIMNEHSLNTLE